MLLTALGAARADGDPPQIHPLEQAETHQRAGRHAEALKIAGDVLAGAPADADRLAQSRRLVITSLLATGQYEGAEKAIEEGLRATPNDLELRRRRFDLWELLGRTDALTTEIDFAFKLFNETQAEDVPTLLFVARAAGTEDPQGAFEALDEALRKEPHRHETYLLQGFHAHRFYAFGLAQEAFEALLEALPGHPDALAGLAEVALSQGKLREAGEHAAQALAQNPRHERALCVKASILRVEDRYEDSLAQIKAALALNPNSLPALCLLAAHHATLGEVKLRDAAIARVRAINKATAEPELAMARAFTQEHRYADAIAAARAALKHDPEGWEGLYIAGQNLLRLGEEKEGAELLEESFARNDFNLWAYNTLQAIDRDLRENAFARFETEHFVVKIDRLDAAILQPYLEAWLDPMYEAQQARYGYTPKGTKSNKGKILLLLFASHEDFSARTVGLPGLGALGACFGQVITMPTPRTRLTGGAGFPWRQVLDHELAHVFALQRSDYRVPRWLTEGMSDWQEQDPHLELDEFLQRALDKGELYPLAQRNLGFHQPRFPQEIGLSYYHAAITVEYLVGEHGEGVLGELLDGYRSGRQTEAVFPLVTSRSLEELDRRIAAQPDAKTRGRLAELLLEIGRDEDARVHAEAALALDPQCAEAHRVLGTLAFRAQDAARALEHFSRAGKDAKRFDRVMMTALSLAATGKSEAAIEALEAARERAPRAVGEQGPYLALARLYTERGDLERAFAVRAAELRLTRDAE
ncbi:MAG: tetratricopeptide repeat protein, partial [Planctomycetota bacterium]